MYCLRKLGRNSEAMVIGKEVLELAPDFSFGQSLYAWVLYDQHVRGADSVTADVVRAGREVVRLVGSKANAYDPAKTPFAATVLRIAKLFSAQGRDIQALTWLEKVDPAQLSLEPFSWNDPVGKTREIASHREKYWSIRTHALERLRRWQECLDASTKALEEVGSLHHDNEIWFKRRIALCHLSLDQAEQALALFEELLARKRTSFMLTDAALAAWKTGQVERALRYALEAALSSGEIRYKLQAIRLIAEVLYRRGELENARLHIQLCMSVRTANNWRQSDDLRRVASAWNVADSVDDVRCLHNRLRRLWARWSEDLTPRQIGRITKVLPHGRSGFIHATSGEDFYFDMREWRDRSKAREGAEVTFATRASFDRKHQRSSTIACEVRAAPLGAR